MARPPMQGPRNPNGRVGGASTPNSGRWRRGETRLKDAGEEVEKILRSVSYGAVLSAYDAAVNAIAEETSYAVSRAADSMEVAFAAAMADEAGVAEKSGRQRVAVDDPSIALRKEAENVRIDGYSSHHRGHSTLSSLTSMRTYIRAVSIGRMDELVDRTPGQYYPEVVIALPITLKKNPEHKGLGLEDNYVYIKTIKFRERSEKRRYNAKGPERWMNRKGPWKLWRALEYGAVSGRIGRVWIKTISKSENRPLVMGEDSVLEIAPKRSIVWGDYWVFMTPNWEWWEAKSKLLPQGAMIVEPPGNVYSGGSHAIGDSKAQLAGELRAVLYGEIDAAIRKSLGGM